MGDRSDMTGFRMEVDVWEEFLRTIEGVIPVEGTRDRVIWVLSSSVKFSCNFQEID